MLKCLHGFSVRNYLTTISYLICFLLFHFSTFLFAQIDTSTQLENKPRIIFKNQSVLDSSVSQFPATDSANPKIIFKNNSSGQIKRIEMVSSEQFTANGEIYNIGDQGNNLKRMMIDNPEAVRMIESAYSKRTTGNVLMVVGVATVVAGYILPSTWVKLDEEKHQTYSQTWYWLPGVTAGVIIGGIGYVQYSSLTGRIREAIDYYNKGLLMNNSVK